MALDREGLDEAAAVLKGIMEEVGERQKPPLPDDENTWLSRVASPIVSRT